MLLVVHNSVVCTRTHVYYTRVSIIVCSCVSVNYETTSSLECSNNIVKHIDNSSSSAMYPRLVFYCTRIYRISTSLLVRGVDYVVYS